MKRLLVIEDDSTIASFLSHGLTEVGYIVDTCRDGLSGLELLLGSDYSGLVLDLVLPRLDGWAVLAGMREQGLSVPTLVLSGLTEVADRLRAFGLGADDFLQKPFFLEELQARLAAILRRAAPERPAPAHRPQAVEDLTIDPKRVAVTRKGRPIRLSMKEFQLLELLVAKRGEVVSRALISESVWNTHREIDSNVIEVTIQRLRAKVDEGSERKLIHTVRGRGYVVR